jgi:23S rRNA (adenine2030-N6)-methyltransferase
MHIHNHPGAANLAFMNYRHAYHAGNHTEVFKHAVLALLLDHLRKKPKPFTVLDTHAGAGIYDLQSDEAGKTGEAADGIGRVFGKTIPSAAGFLDIVRRLNPDGLRTYPGSPAVIQALLRQDDRLIACELHPDDAVMLRRNFRRDPRVAVHRRDGYRAIGAFVPPATRRGLVFVDPSFEERDEFERLAGALNTGLRKWPTGIFAAWYPIKSRKGPDDLRDRYGSDNPPTLCCELLREPVAGNLLAGSGLVICNPPWRLDDRLAALCRDLLHALDATRGSYSVDWWIAEHPPADRGA